MFPAVLQAKTRAQKGIALAASMSETLELKMTLNLPKTGFPMKANLPLNEPRQLEAWQEADLYQQILEARTGRPLFVLHDGPPYPTRTIHLRTRLTKVLNDLSVNTKCIPRPSPPSTP